MDPWDILSFINIIDDILIWLLTRPYYAFTYIAMGSHKRTMVNDMYKEMKKIKNTLGSIAYDGIINYAELEKLRERSVDISDISERFIKHRIDLYLETRDIYDRYIYTYFVNQEGTSKSTIDQGKKTEIIHEAGVIVREITKLIDSY